MSYIIIESLYQILAIIHNKDFGVGSSSSLEILGQIVGGWKTDLTQQNSALVLGCIYDWNIMCCNRLWQWWVDLQNIVLFKWERWRKKRVRGIGEETQTRKDQEKERN